MSAMTLCVEVAADEGQGPQMAVLAFLSTKN
jgi:hypothetical protein